MMERFSSPEEVNKPVSQEGVRVVVRWTMEGEKTDVMPRLDDSKERTIEYMVESLDGQVWTDLEERALSSEPNWSDRR